MFRFSPFFATLLSLFLFSEFAFSASVEEEQERLEALRQSLQIQQSNLQEMQAELVEYPAKISAARSDLEKAETELAGEEQELAALRDKAGTEPSSAMEREMSLQEHAVRMSQRRVRSENRMLERYQRYRDDLEADVAEANSDIAVLKRRIEEQDRRLADAEAAAQAPRPAPAVPQPAVSAPPAEQVAIPEPEPAPQEAPEPVDEPPQLAGEQASEELPPLSEADYEAFKIAEETMARVKARVADNPDSSPRFPNLLLMGSGIDDTPFRHLGGDQYRADVVLPSGRQRFRIDSLRFRADISANNAGDTYVFIVDASDRARLKAYYFKKTLLAYIGEEPEVATDSGNTSAPEAEEPALQTVSLADGKTVQLSEDDAYALEVAREHTALLRELQQEGQSGDPLFSRLNLSGNLVETTRFEYIGNDQYRAEVTMQSGRQSVRVNRSSFRIDIPDADEGETYLFFVDASRPSRLQLTYYKKSILDYL